MTLASKEVSVEQPLATSSGPVGAAHGASPAEATHLRENAAVPGAGSAASAAVPAATSYSFADQQTLSQLRRGNWAAMEGLVQRYQDRLYATVLRMVHHPEDAADLVQETFVRAMQAVSKFEGKSSLYTWLFRIAVNLCLSHRRAGKYRKTVTLEGAGDESERLNHQADGLRRQLAQETELDPAASAEQRMDYERLLQALATLEPEFRAVIVLRDIEECDYEQMAAILEVPVGTIKSRLFRARGALRQLLRVEAAKPPRES
jgi:RNA polymerase sigma-70 factor, ECF subfamily